jgi:hypothetical protein
MAARADQSGELKEAAGEGRKMKGTYLILIRPHLREGTEEMSKKRIEITMGSDITPKAEPLRTVKHLAYDLKDIVAEVARAGEQHDCGTLPRCAAELRRIADELIRAVEDEGLVADVPF